MTAKRLTFGRVFEQPSVQEICMIIYPLGHGLLAYVQGAPSDYPDPYPCTVVEEWAAALAPNLPTDTAQ